ncbi:MAG: ribonuclease P protein component [Ferruginibacter sp.]
MENKLRYRLNKKQKLKSRKDIEAIFATGKSFTAFPLRVNWIAAPLEKYAVVGVGVSSRNFKKAVDRNRIKRILREAYRLQQHEAPAGLKVFFMYTGRELPAYEDVYKSVGKCLRHLVKNIKHSQPQDFKEDNPQTDEKN